MYHVVRGNMLIEVAGQEYLLHAGDTIVVNPFSSHRVRPGGYEFLCLVFTSNCGGDEDKYPDPSLDDEPS